MSTPYARGIEAAFASLKRTDDADELRARSLELPGHGTLVPLCELHDRDPATIELLACWREKHMAVYPTQFTVTLEGTARWLRERVLDVPDRISFLILDTAGVPVGHGGFAEARPDGYLKLDNLIRGVEGRAPGIMEASVKRLRRWSGELGVSTLRTIVPADNERALEFLLRIGFTRGAVLRMRRHEEHERVEYRPLEAGDTAEPDRVYDEIVLAVGD
jgi:RimJ/RimL family protein N-acetyltransferase